MMRSGGSAAIKDVSASRLAARSSGLRTVQAEPWINGARVASGSACSASQSLTAICSATVDRLFGDAHPHPHAEFVQTPGEPQPVRLRPRVKLAVDVDVDREPRPRRRAEPLL